MPNNGFVFANGPLVEVKRDDPRQSVPADTTLDVFAADMNLIRSNEDSLRQAHLQGNFVGLAPQSSPPSTDPAAMRMYLDNTGNVKVVFPSGTTVKIADNTGAYDATARAGGGGGMTSLTGDVTATGPGASAATVASVGGSSAAAVHAAEQAYVAATSSNTVSTLVKRDGSGNFSAGTITANLTGNVSGSAGSFTGSLSGDVTGTQGATAVASVGGSTAANVHAAQLAYAAATNANTPSTLVLRDGSGNFSAGTITANLTGNASGSAGSFTGSLVGDVTGTQGATVVASVGGSTAANVHAAELLANAATSANTANTIVRRDGSGNISANVTGSNVQVGGVTATPLVSPVNATFTLGAGTLATGTKYYRVTALWNDGETLPSTETSLAVTGPAGVNVNWGAVAGATGYKIYGRTTGAELLLATVGLVTTWLDDGSVTPSGAMPTINSTGGLSMPGNQTYTGTSGVRFYSQITDNTIQNAFEYNVPAAWTGASGAGNLYAVKQGSTVIFSVNTFGGATCTGAFSSPVYGYNAGQPATFQGASNELGFQNGSPYGSANVILNAQNASGNPNVEPSSCLAQLREQGWVKSIINLDGFWVGGVNAVGLSVQSISTPIFPVAFTGIAGTLVAGTYYYRVSALNANGETLANLEKSFTLGSTGGIRLYWLPVIGATSYNIYGRTTGAEQLLTNVYAHTTSLFNGQAGTNSGYFYKFDDDGSLTPSGALPSANTTAGVTGGFAIKALPTPVLRTFTSGAGTLVAGTYYYRVSAVNDFGETLAAAEKSLTLGSTGGVNVNWLPVPGASKFKIYGRNTGAELLIGTVDSCFFTFLDNGSVTPSGALPTLNTTGNCSTVGKWIDAGFTDQSGTPGSATQNSATGKSAIPSGSNTITITNNLVGANSIVDAWIQQSAFDTTLTLVQAYVPSAGSFVIKGNGNATSNVIVAWEVQNN